MIGHNKSQIQQITCAALEASLDAFRDAYKAATTQTPTVHNVINAIENKRVIYLAEPWITHDSNTVANELLFRYRNAPGQIYNYGSICESIANARLTAEFDLVNIFNILSWIPDDAENIAATINVSHDLLTNHALMDEVVNVMQHRKGPPIIFEILEDDRQFTGEEITYLESLTKQGFCFALDDFRVNTPSDWQRLSDLKNVISYIKLDGQDSVRPYLDNPNGGFAGIARNITAIKNICGLPKKIIAEWVKTRDEADILFSLGVHAIQGHDVIMHQNTSQKTNKPPSQKRFK